MKDCSSPHFSQKIKKSSAILLDSHYDHPNTSLLTFHFHPNSSPDILARLRNSSLQSISIEKKHIFILDALFSKEEGEELRNFSRKAPFSRKSYGSVEAIERGEKPARSMNGEERWNFFSKPPAAIRKVYALLGSFAHLLKADVTTMPWELCDSSSCSSPSVIANFVEEASEESMEFGKHRDCDPEKNIPFGIPILYAKEKVWHPIRFVNGACGKPWIVSLMLYATEETFSSERGMGTIFCKKDQKFASCVSCEHMRLVLFESDIFHTIEASSKGPGWRVSYVFKLVLNPRKKTQCLKTDFLSQIGEP